MKYRELISMFMGFALYSGIGWLCDFCAFIALVQVFKVAPFYANIASSFLGVTFVYFSSLRLVFNKQTDRHVFFLSVYWSYQCVSILSFSAVLKVLVGWLELQNFYVLPVYAGIIGKVIITPFTLLINFIFMKFLSRFMKTRKVVE